MTSQEMFRNTIAQILGNQLLQIVDYQTENAFLKASLDTASVERDHLISIVTKSVTTEESAQKSTNAKTKGVNHSRL